MSCGKRIFSEADPNLKKVLILAEGQTEETFIKRVLNPYWQSKDIYAVPKIITTKKLLRGNEFKGGIVEYDKLRPQIFRLLNDTSATIISTFIDYYGLPDSFPGKNTLAGQTVYERVEYLERKLSDDIQNEKFVSYYSLHEFEAILFSVPSVIGETMMDEQKKNILQSIRNSFRTPEEINDNPSTCPSARIKGLFRNYEKPLHGFLISQRIGLETIRLNCPHFNRWIENIESY